MPDTFENTLPGGAPIIKAGMRNAMRDAALAEVLRAHFVRSPGISYAHHLSWVKAKNNSGAAVTRGKVLALTGLLITAANNEDQFWRNPVFTGEVPQRDLEDNDLGSIGICLEPIATSKVGRVAVSGVVPCLVNIGSTSHKYCDITDNSTAEMTSAEQGPYRILSSPGSTGSAKKCHIMLGPNTEERVLLGKTDSSHSKGASGTVSVYDGTKGSESDTTRNITAWNRFADLESDKWVMCAWVWNGYEIIAAEC